MKYLLFFFLFSACGSNHSDARKPDISYKEFLEKVHTDKKIYAGQPGKNAGDYLFTLIHQQIPAYWTGTPWDFNGTTREPGKGTIACGYFITNTLYDLGFPIERVKLAQAASSVLINTVTVNSKWISGFDAFKQYMDAQPDKSVFIVGLDFHTGYVTKDKGQAYFIHSNYIQRKGVMKEKIESSDALKASKVFMIGCLTANDALLKKWIEN